MRKLLFTILLASFSFSFHAQNVHLNRMEAKQREEHLVKIAKEVVLNFGPDYYRTYKKPEISEERVFEGRGYTTPESQRCIGRHYYVVTYLYDKNKERLSWNYASQVEIWADNGEPKGVQFGNGIGIDFLDRPYRKWVSAGIKENEMIPYQQLPQLERKGQTMIAP